VAIPLTSCRAHRALAQLVLQRCCKDTAASKLPLRLADFLQWQRACGFTDQSQQWIKKLRCRAFGGRIPPGARLPR
jgi:hypothetical protein